MTTSRACIKAVLFDFMGTCLDWHSIILSTLPSALPESIRSEFALIWRQTYFAANATRLASDLPVENIDITHAKTLDSLLESKYTNLAQHFTPEVKTALIAAWHHQSAWPDTLAALKQLRSLGYELYVHANGTTRLQLDLCRSAGLHFDMLFSSELLGVYKPAHESFDKALELLKLKPEECVMVAAHAWDTRGGQEVGMKTVYVKRWTDDTEEDWEKAKTEFDVYLEGMEGLADAVVSFG